MRDRIRDELRFERREVLQKEHHQETIFTKVEQVLVQRVYVPFGILVHDVVGDDDRSAFVRGTDTVDREAPGRQDTEPNKLSNAFDRW